MDKQTEERVAAAVKRILENADMTIMTASNLRNLASVDTGVDLNIPRCKKMVKRMIEEFLATNRKEECHDTDESRNEDIGEEVVEIEHAKRNRKEIKRLIIHEDEDKYTLPSKKQKAQANAEYKKLAGKPGVGESRCNEEDENDANRVEKDEEDCNDTDSEEEQSSEDETHSNKKGETKFKRDDSGGIIVCEVGSKRRVTVQEFRGKPLVSIREYYEKDGKMLPGSKGMSLTVDQWKIIKEAIPQVQEAIRFVGGAE